MSEDDLEREDDESRAKMARVRQNPRLADARAAAAQGADVSGYEVYDPNAPERSDPDGQPAHAAPDAARAYVPPTNLPAKKRRDTLELQPRVALSPSIDPRKAMTMPSLGKQLELEEEARPTIPKRPPELVAAGEATPFGPPVVLDPGFRSASGLATPLAPLAADDHAARQPFAPRVMAAPPGSESAFAGPAVPAMTPPAPVGEPISPTPAGGVSLTSEVFIGRVVEDASASEPEATTEPVQPKRRWSTEPLLSAAASIDPATLPSSHRPTSLDDDVVTAIPVSRKKTPVLGIAVALAAVGILALVVVKSIGGGGSAEPTEGGAQASSLQQAPSADAPIPPPKPSAQPAPEATAVPPIAPSAPSAAAKPSDSARPKPAAKPTSPKPAGTFRDIF